MNRFAAWVLTLCILLGLCACGDTPPDVPAKTHGVGRTTLMVYMIGSAEESSYDAASAALEQLETAGFDLDTVNVVVCAGGASRWSNRLLSRRKLTTLTLSANGFVKTDAVSAVSMGDPATLSSFLTDTVSRCPADNYALLLWGGGCHPATGLSKDVTHDDTLTLSELTTAMDASPFGGDNKLTFVGIDASFGASAESAFVWDDYADYLIASQGTLPLGGLACRTLGDLGTVDTLTLADTLSEATVSDSRADFPHVPASLSCLDLSKAGKLETALTALLDAAHTSFDTHRIAVLSARAATKTVGQETSLTHTDMVDLADAVDRLTALFPNETAAVNEALSAVTVIRRTTDSLCGLSMHYPYRAATADDTHPLFARVVEAHHTPEDTAFSDKLTPTLQNGVFSLTLSDEQASRLAGSTVYIFCKNSDDTLTPVSICPAALSGTVLTARVDGTAVYAKDKWNRYVLPSVTPLSTQDDRFAAEITVSNTPVVWEDLPEDTDRYRVTATAFFLRNEDGTVSPVAVSPDRSDRTETVELADFTDGVFPLSQKRIVTRQANGTLAPLDEWPATDYAAADGLSFSEEVTYVTAPLEAGDYVVAAELEDVSGHRVMSEFVPFVSNGVLPAVITAGSVTVSGGLASGIVLYDSDDAAVTLLKTEDGALTLSLTNRTEQTLALTAYTPVDGKNEFCGSFSVPAGETTVLANGLRINNVPVPADGGTAKLTITLQESLSHRVLLHELSVTAAYRY